MKGVPLASIEMDTSIQCRASIDTGTVNEYAEAMQENAEFPPVILFRDPDGKHWIGDGWHRVMAARQCGFVDIPADVRDGGRKDALRFALGANTANGLRRTNADKRRCVEIALAEFGGMSSRAIADMCGVAPNTVEASRPATAQIEQLTRTGLDGKQRPASMPRKTADPETVRQAAIEAEEARYLEKEESGLAEETKTPAKITAQVIADKATFFLSQIKPRMEGREAALLSVIAWCRKQLKEKA